MLEAFSDGLSRQLGELRVGGNEKSRDYYIPTLHYARCISAVIALWRTAHYHSNLLVSSFLCGPITDLASVHLGHDLGDHLGKDLILTEALGRAEGVYPHKPVVHLR